MIAANGEIRVTTKTTEQLHPDAHAMDQLPAEALAQLLARAQQDAAATVQTALPTLCAGAMAMATSLRGEGRLIYIAAGSSGLMAAADAMELGGTFGIPADRIGIHMAGGIPQNAHMPGDTEDGTDNLLDALQDLNPNDTVIALSASGTTAYTLTGAKIAHDAGATVIGIANNAGTDLLNIADHPVFLPTAAEVLSGSTRMGAATAQKVALNTLSTLMARELGHIYDGMMVNMVADNAKLQARAETIVSTITGAMPTQARAALEQTQGALKPAILLAAGAQDVAAATALLTRSNGHLRPALQEIKIKTTT